MIKVQWYRLPCSSTMFIATALTIGESVCRTVWRRVIRFAFKLLHTLPDKRNLSCWAKVFKSLESGLFHLKHDDTIEHGLSPKRLNYLTLFTIFFGFSTIQIAGKCSMLCTTTVSPSWTNESRASSSGLLVFFPEAWSAKHLVESCFLRTGVSWATGQNRSSMRALMAKVAPYALGGERSAFSDRPSLSWRSPAFLFPRDVASVLQESGAACEPWPGVISFCWMLYWWGFYSCSGISWPCQCSGER